MHIVLVHGMGGSASSWSSVAPLLDVRGISYSIADNWSQSLAEDVATVERLIADASEPVLLVGHSYGGAVITGAGRHADVRGLVYVSAFGPAEGETINSIVESYPPATVSTFFDRGDDGAWIPQDGPAAREALAWDVPDEIWLREQHDKRVSSNEIFRTPAGVPAWASKPAWYMVATQDQHIVVEAQRDMAARMNATVVDVGTTHAIQHVQPQCVVDTIEQAIAMLS
ncbi:alpha/beta fold hydrolase [Microbacterium indicum]|uniref:alpha/beta fold hydrolase n=1 Tax=Microbacterium indicum TaxID=358100 RepID=UPI00048F78BA|nr:alpha/beta hydrolase [Microbacterium indicum]